jgi:hypothetical protein
MNRKDFLGPKTITVAAGIPPMGTVFTTLPPVNYRPAIDPLQSLPWAPGRNPVCPASDSQNPPHAQSPALPL